MAVPLECPLTACSLQAEADRLGVLEKYRGKCEPTFLFYAVSTSADTELLVDCLNHWCSDRRIGSQEPPRGLRHAKG